MKTSAHDERLFDLNRTVQELAAVRQAWRVSQQRPSEGARRELPSQEILDQVVAGLRGALFPLRLGPPDLRQESEDFYVGHTLHRVLHALHGQVCAEMGYRAARAPEAGSAPPAQAREIVQQFAEALPQIRALLDADTLAAFSGDPAAQSVDEVLLCYPGILAMIHHRIAHQLYKLGAPLVARLIAELAHGRTGIDIHPGATIGRGFFIDHGTGVVIGETAVIGERVRIYQAVTLGARSFPTDELGHLRKGLPRHPVVEDDVVIYAGATVLGRVTVGRGAVIGGNVWVTQDVAPGDHVRQAISRHEAGSGAPRG
ncbi:MULTISPECIES: serine O-acetyltransferase EpsC [Ramlibacter]|uniref:serine O-acetyltransferase n=1 Tax=Ramlibacter aquaticus TaxID=2780094 RepID=A0ABR9SGD6_9BURK|nr:MULTISPECIES: serine O-acetyltransferase EpsC [Ramlibacter]MBE7941415.1 serine acetyltransferase [Ramlibacter aquaticus]